MPPSTPTDPMGLLRMQEAVSRLVSLRGSLSSSSDPSDSPALIVDQLAEAFEEVSTRYEFLKDRYALLKRTNAALCDELVWLRDQIDDLSSPTKEG